MATRRDYRLQQIIATGTVAQVWSARRGQTDHALKVTPLRHRTQGLRELDILSRLSHPYLVPLQGFFFGPCPQGDDANHHQPVSETSASWLYLCLPLARGTLDDLMGQGRHHPSTKLAWIKGLISALACLHRAGVGHGDLKPTNLLWSDDRLLLADLTSAIYIRHQSHHVYVSQYTAPEYLKREGDGRWPPIMDHRRLDDWALGCLIGYIISGQPLFQDTAMMSGQSRLARYLEQPDAYLAPYQLAQPWLDVVRGLLEPDPCLRLRLESLLDHPMLRGQTEVAPEIRGGYLTLGSRNMWDGLLCRWCEHLGYEIDIYELAQSYLDHLEQVGNPEILAAVLLASRMVGPNTLDISHLSSPRFTQADVVKIEQELVRSCSGQLELPWDDPAPL